MTAKIISTLNGQKLKTPPIWFMRQAGRYLPEYNELKGNKNFLDLCYNPNLAVKITQQPLERYDLDAYILFSDILVIPDALGQKVDFIKGKGPVLKPIKNEKQIDLLENQLPKMTNYLKPVYETVSFLKSNKPENITLIGFSGAPWTLATYMIEGQSSKDFFNARQWAYHQSDLFSHLMDILVQGVILHLEQQIQSGAEVVQIFDSWSSILDYDGFYQWVIEPTKKIVSFLKERYPHVFFIGFPKGAGEKYKDYIHQTNIDAIGLDSSVDLADLNQKVDQRICFQGNLDPIYLLAKPEIFKNKAENILNILQDRPHIFNLGHGILPQTPPEHVKMLIDFVRCYGEK